MLQILESYSFIQILFYSFQQEIYSSLSSQNNYYIAVKFICVLILGILTSLTPCFLSSIPLILSYSNSVRITFIDKNLIILGLLSSFIGIICFIYFFNYQANWILVSAPIVSYFIFIIISLNLLQIWDISSLFFFTDIKSFNIIRNNGMYLQSYFIGVFVGLASIPCNVGIILTTISWLYNSSNFIGSLIFLLIYLLGFIIPFLIIFYVPFDSSQINVVVRFWNNFVPLSGAMMLSFAFFSLLNKLFI